MSGRKKDEIDIMEALILRHVAEEMGKRYNTRIQTEDLINLNVTMMMMMMTMMMLILVMVIAMDVSKERGKGNV